MQACRLELPQAHPSLVVSSLFCEPLSRCLSVMLSDSSLLLFPPLSLSSPLSISSSPTLIPPPCSSACFLRLHATSHPARVIFLAALPESGGGAGIFLRAWILRNNQVFTRVHVNFKRDRSNRLNCSSSNTGSQPENDKLGAVLDLSHGFSIKLAGSVNVFALHSVSARKIWILAAKLVDDRENEARVIIQSVNLIKCSVIDCSLPVFSIRVSSRHMVLGEENGIRVFPLRPLVKGTVEKQSKVEERKRRSNSKNCGSFAKNSDGNSATKGVGSLGSWIVPRTDAIDPQIDSNFRNKNQKGSLITVPNSNFSNMIYTNRLEILGAVDSDGCVGDLLKNSNGLLCPTKKNSRNGVIPMINGYDDIYSTAVYSKSVVSCCSDEIIEESFYYNNRSASEGTYPTKDHKKSIPGRCFEFFSKELKSKDSSLSAKMDSADYKGKAEADCISVKIRSVKLRQDSGELGSFFAAFGCVESHGSRCTAPAFLSRRAVSIHPVSEENFIILDSCGDLHFLRLHGTVPGSEVNNNQASTASRGASMRRLDCTMKVQMLAVVPDISMRSQTAWISDGSHSVHIMPVPDQDVSANEMDNDASQEKLLQFSATHAIFTGEKIQDVISFTPNTALILSQDGMKFLSSYPQIGMAFCLDDRENTSGLTSLCVFPSQIIGSFTSAYLVIHSEIDSEIGCIQTDPGHSFR